MKKINWITKLLIGVIVFWIIILAIPGDKENIETEVQANTQVEQEQPKEEVVKSNKEYLKAMVDTLAIHWTNSYKYFSCMSNGDVADNIENIKSVFDSIEAEWSLYNDLKFNDDELNLKTQFDTLRDKQLKAIELYRQGLDEMNVEKLNEANKYVYEASDVLKQINLN